MVNFEYKEIGDIAEVTKLAGFEFTKHINYKDDGEIIALRALNLRKGELDLSDIKRIDKDVSDFLVRSKLYKNDIILTYTGNGYGDCAIIEENNKYHLAPNICKITPKADIIEPYFLYSYIRSNEFYKTISNHMTGSSQPTIPMKMIRILKVPVPPKNIQKKVVSIILTINQKIKQNKKINKNLEQQVFALFDASFPDIINGENIIGELITPKRGKSLLSKDAILGNIPVVAGGLEPSTYHNVSNTQAPVVTISASGANAGFVNLWNIPVWSSDSSFIDNSITPYVFFWYVMLKKRQKEIFDAQTGSAQPHIYPKHIAEMPISDVSEKRIYSFETQVSPFFNLIGKNKNESVRLSEIRDFLLLKLISGEIDVSNIDL